MSQAWLHIIEEHQRAHTNCFLLCSSPLVKALQQFWQLGKLPDGQKETQRDE